MPTSLQELTRDVAAEGTPAQHHSRRRRVPVKLIVAGAAVAVLVPVGMRLADLVPDQPLGQDVVDSSTTPLLLALDDLSEYHAATGTFQIVVDREVDTRYMPSVISGERVSFLATGTADAYVDFEGLDDGRVTLSPDGESAVIVLPAPRLGEVRIDPAESRVLDRDRGLVERVGDALGDNPVDDTELYALAEDRLTSAAAASDLRERAQTNTATMLTGLVRSLGVEEVDVRFDEPADLTG